MTVIEGTVTISRFMDNSNSFLAVLTNLILALPSRVFSSQVIQVKLFSEVIRIRPGTELGNKCVIRIAQYFLKKSQFVLFL